MTPKAVLSALLSAAILLSAPAAAQTELPDAPTPEASKVRLETSLQEALARIRREAFQRPDEGLQLLPRPGEAGAPAPNPGPVAGFGLQPADPSLRLSGSLNFHRDSVEINLLRPSNRIIIGGGYREDSIRSGQRELRDLSSKFLFLRIRLDRPRDDERRHIATVTSADLSPRPHVETDEYSAPKLPK